MVKLPALKNFICLLYYYILNTNFSIAFLAKFSQDDFHYDRLYKILT